MPKQTTSTKFPTIQVEGWISVNDRGTIPADRKMLRPQWKGFPIIVRNSDDVPARYTARKVLVTVEDADV